MRGRVDQPGCLQTHDVSGHVEAVRADERFVPTQHRYESGHDKTNPRHHLIVVFVLPSGKKNIFKYGIFNAMIHLHHRFVEGAYFDQSDGAGGGV